MIKSMTGFGKASCLLAQKKITVELRSLNSKQLDFNTKMPATYKEKELDIRSIIGNYLERGKIDLIINTESTDDANNFSINKSLAKKYYKELKQLATQVKEEPADFFSLLLRMPDVIQSEKEELDEKQWKTLKVLIEKACVQLDKFRLQEGKILEKDFVKRIHIILALLQQIAPFEKERINNTKERIRKHIAAYNEDLQIDENRFEQELIYYLEKMDITEEKVRLKQHCDYFLSTMKDSSANGKKLSFIIQEIGREINTLGSKANDVSIQKIVVQMKDELEKIKEQILNIL